MAVNKIKRPVTQIGRFKKGHIPFPITLIGVSNLYISWSKGQLTIQQNKKV